MIVIRSIRYPGAYIYALFRSPVSFCTRWRQLLRTDDTVLLTGAYYIYVHTIYVCKKKLPGDPGVCWLLSVDGIGLWQAECHGSWCRVKGILGEHLAKQAVLLDHG